MTYCYCANYYGSIGCRNVVGRFGDRCKLCMALKSGASLSDGLLPEGEMWTPQPPPQQKRKEGHRSGHHSSSTGRSSRAHSGAKKH